MHPLLKRLLIWLAVIGVLLLLNHWMRSSWVDHNPQVSNGLEVTGKSKAGWFTAHPYFFPIAVCLVYLPIRLYMIKKRPPNGARSNDGLAK